MQQNVKEPYKRMDSISRGRHLMSTEKILKGQIVLNERPLLSLQSNGNAHNGALVCRSCRAFVGGPGLCLGIASGRINRNNLFNEWKSEEDVTLKIFPCRYGCGELFCSAKCEDDMWNCGGHDLLCTGRIPDSEINTNCTNDEEILKESDELVKEESELKNNMHPLLQFKVHAIQNNEILLMVGDLIATVVSIYRKQLEAKSSTTQFSSTSSPNLDDLIAPYFDFTLKPWWEVATEPLMKDPTTLALDRTLRDMCKTSAEYLKQAMFSLIDSKNYITKGVNTVNNPRIFASTLNQALRECDDKYHMFSGLFFGQIIGSFEQNAIGIRARHPLCRDVLENNTLRDRYHDDLVKCIERAGMTNNEDDDADAESMSDKSTTLVELKSDTIPSKDASSNAIENEHKYTVDDITCFIAELHIDENRNRENLIGTAESDGDDFSDRTNIDGDDLDLLFTPLDGIAMYSTTCKMNHSCCPNIVAKYVYSCSSGGEGSRWGQNFPMVIQCVALRDIEEGEELCISYISNDQPLEKRQEALANYGFECRCSLCIRETSSGSNADTNKCISNETTNIEDDIFGIDSDEDGDVEDGHFEEDCKVDDDMFPSIVRNNVNKNVLAKCVAKLNFQHNLSISGGIPIRILASTTSFVVQLGKQALQKTYAVNKKIHVHTKKTNDENLISFSSTAIAAIKKRDFATCIEMGYRGELSGFELLKENGKWPYTLHRELYECSVIIASIGYAKNGSFLPALQMLDKASIFGLPRNHLKEFYDYVETHAHGCYHFHTSNFRISYPIVPDYKDMNMQSQLYKVGLSSQIKFPINEVDVELFKLESFHESYQLTEKPIVIRNYARSWPALQRWRNLNYFIRYHGNRIVPIERGIMSEESGMEEELMSIRDFVTMFLVPSTLSSVWSLELDTSKSMDKMVAYLAQHNLFDQIPGLLHDINPKPSLCGSSTPFRINVWMGTGGTKTPLHYDSYDNLFVQIVGAKYVRLYSPDETDKLYVLSGNGPSYAKQGNMSAVHCEKEDFTGKHGNARNAKFTEILMLPGDLLFIPAKTWHYVRGLSTSISVNFWW